MAAEVKIFLKTYFSFIMYTYVIKTVCVRFVTNFYS